MTPAQLNRAVARATGESVAEIARRGFQLLHHETIELEPEDLIIDWDELELCRNVSLVEQKSGVY